GTVGLANHLEYLLSVAKVYSKNHEVAFIIMGSGARWDHIRTLARKESLDNIMFLPPGDKEQVRDVLSISDAVYISFKDAPILASGSPNKFFDGLAAGKLIIINFKGWIKEVIEQNHCGFAYDPHRPDQFVKQLTPYLTDESHLKRSQCAARRLAEQDYSTDKQLQNLQYIFKQTSTI
ncbi:MAG: glycosyltransferase, partial [Bacteroidota bacterium]